MSFIADDHRRNAGVWEDIFAYDGNLYSPAVARL